MEWITDSVSKQKADYCRLCKCDTSLSNMGEQALHKLGAEEKHEKRLKDLD